MPPSPYDGSIDPSRLKRSNAMKESLPGKQFDAGVQQTDTNELSPETTGFPSGSRTTERVSKNWPNWPLDGGKTTEPPFPNCPSIDPSGRMRTSCSGPFMPSIAMSSPDAATRILPSGCRVAAKTLVPNGETTVPPTP